MTETTYGNNNGADVQVAKLQFTVKPMQESGMLLYHTQL